MTRFDMLVDQLVDYVTARADADEYHVVETRSKTFPAVRSVVVENANGDVDVRGEDRDDLAVDITWQGESLSALETARVVTEGGDDEPFRVAVEHDDDVTDVAVDLSVRVPAETRVDRVETENGDVRLSDAAGDARLSTANGSITAEDVDGALTLRATNGRVSVTDCPGIERIETNTGTIDLRLSELHDDATLRTATGHVTLELDPEIGLDLYCETNVGEIDAPLLDRSVSGIGRTSIVDALGDAGPELRVEATVGSVLVTAPDPDDAEDSAP